MYLFEQYGMEGEELFNYSSLTDLNFPLHFHRAYEIVVVEKGEMVISVEEKDYLLKENDAVFIFPNQLHKLATPNHSLCRVMIFSPELIGHFFSSYKSSVPMNNRFVVSEIPTMNDLTTVTLQKAVLYSYLQTN
ncbi:MAG: AraC family ligand binding domain-containing protein [Alkalibacterium sp.]|nr:AraC family ligand binding domain-containing protein [Alkalibacterium sp.]